MKIYLKTCSLYEVRNATEYGLIDGAYLVSETDDEPCMAPDSNTESIVRNVNGPVFMRPSGSSAEEILEESRELLKISPNIVIRIKLSLEALKACRILSYRDVLVAIDGITNSTQAVLAAKSGAQFCVFEINNTKSGSSIDQAEIINSSALFEFHCLKCEISAGNIADIESLRKTVNSKVHSTEIDYELLMRVPCTDI